MIKFVYFDVGGVAIKDFSGTNKWEELKKELGISRDQSEEFENIYNLYQDEINTTREIDSLIPIYKEKFNIKLPANYSYLTDGLVKRFEQNKGIWPIIEKAKSKYKIGLLTNMHPNMLNEIKKAGLLPDIVFDQVIDSSVEQVSKPYKEIYSLAAKRSGYQGGEILFIDNSEINLKVPKEMGWSTFLYDPTDIEASNVKLSEFISDLK